MKRMAVLAGLVFLSAASMGLALKLPWSPPPFRLTREWAPRPPAPLLLEDLNPDEWMVLAAVRLDRTVPSDVCVAADKLVAEGRLTLDQADDAVPMVREYLWPGYIDRTLRVMPLEDCWPLDAR